MRTLDVVVRTLDDVVKGDVVKGEVVKGLVVVVGILEVVAEGVVVRLVVAIDVVVGCKW